MKYFKERDMTDMPRKKKTEEERRADLLKRAEERPDLFVKEDGKVKIYADGLPRYSSQYVTKGEDRGDFEAQWWRMTVRLPDSKYTDENGEKQSSLKRKVNLYIDRYADLIPDRRTGKPVKPTINDLIESMLEELLNSTEDPEISVDFTADRERLKSK